MSRLLAAPGHAVLASTPATLPPEQGESGGESMRHLVREATRDDHQRLDRAMSGLRLDEPVSYGIFLTIHYMALRALSGRWRARDQADFSGLASCLVDDLWTLQYPARHAVDTARRAKANPSSQWGIAYVIRGSRLGGAVLRQRVPATYPASFLDFVPSLRWPDFVKQLDDEARLMNPRTRTQIIQGAEQAFEAFAVAADTFRLFNDRSRSTA